jgi:hypothetical protein
VVSAANKYGSGPHAQTLEVTLIGPGFGESVLVHVGDNCWFVVDSAQEAGSRRSAPLVYLDHLGIQADALKAVVISHYDDDHIRGIAEIIKSAADAKVITSSAFTSGDFTRLVANVVEDKTRRGRTGADEASEVLNHLIDSDRGVMWAISERSINLEAFQNLSHRQTVRFTTLTPSDAEVTNFLSWAASMLPKAGTARRRMPKRERNDVSVVLLVEVGSVSILLGADLEEEGRADTGWTAVLASRAGQSWPQSGLYKVAHHGSKTGHHDGVWQKMLIAKPMALLAPWMNGGRIVPDLDARRKIVALSSEAYTTTTARIPKPPRRERAVEKTIARATKTFRTAEPVPGLLRARLDLNNVAAGWVVEQFDGAVPLADWK